ncbi:MULTISPECIES: competence protein ComJ [Sorangium]|uniref:Competence protein n=1 Tax=Sorangium cellulosum TaxID=56 RepID=A0A4P2QI91_SORCE|nr:MULTISPECIES: competence protein ComJ [Sorangium]AUX29630.1 competence protein [Sorangium cellulosum]
MSQFSLEVAYSQIFVFQSCLKDPFNDWTDAHVAQGFSWRPGSVSFRTLDVEGMASVIVEKGTALDVSPSATRAIQVPFHVPVGVDVEVGTLTGTVVIELDPGDYTVLFEHGRCLGSGMWCKFRFVPGTTAPRVVRRDEELSPGEELLMDAQPAVP